MAPDPSTDTNGMPDLEAFSQMSADLYKQWEDSLSSWWDQVVESPAFLEGAGNGMAGVSKIRAQYEQQMDDNLSKMHLPSRGDITRLARIATLLERRLLDLEDRLLEMKDALAERDARAARLEAELIQARIEAAEGRIEQRTTLQALQARLAAIEEASKPKRGSRAAATKSTTTKKSAKTTSTTTRARKSAGGSAANGS